MHASNKDEACPGFNLTNMECSYIYSYILMCACLYVYRGIGGEGGDKSQIPIIFISITKQKEMKFVQ